MPFPKISQIFYDEKRKRWWYSKRTILSVAVFFAVVFSVAMSSIIVHPALPPLNLGEPAITSRGVPNIPRANNNLPGNVALDPTKQSALQKSEVQKTKSDKTVNYQPKVYGFYVNWDEDSFISLKSNIDKIDELIPEWLHLNDSTGAIVVDDQSKQDKTVAFIKQSRPTLPIAPLINNLNQETQAWDADTLSKMLDNPDARTKTIQNMLDFVQQNGFSGISIDFENVPNSEQPNLVIFMKELYDKFHPLGLEVSQNIPMDDNSYNAKDLSQYCDFLILMAYDQYSINDSLAGPISSQAWYADSLSVSFSLLPPQKYVVALGGYGYDWEDSSKTGQDVTFQDAMRLASNSKAVISLDSQALNPTFDYYSKNKKLHHVWFLDGVSLFNQIATGNSYGDPRGYALWRMGSEDPSVWNVFSNRTKLNKDTANLLLNLSYGYDLNYEGQGEILRVTSVPKNGKRELSYNNQSKIITSEKITEPPSSYIITRWGGDNKKKIALTFDDGPDKNYTPKILDILKKYNVPATFFVIGVNANLNSDILKREFDEGNEIGNHTYTHPNIENISSQQFALELDSTERLFEGILGRKSLLFRPPYAEDVEPESLDQIQPLAITDKMGYYSVGMHIDPNDWQKPGVDNIVNSVLNGAKSGEGNIILLHDGGGNRDQTIQALPRIIEGLRANGFELVSISNLMGLPQYSLMPPITKNEQAVAYINNVAFLAIGWFRQILYILFLAGIGLVIVRFLFIGILAVIQKIYSRNAAYKKYEDEYKPAVSVIIPAYNEEKVITKTINSILNSNYPSFEIITVNDGSSDGTLYEIQKEFSQNPRVKIFTKENGGKSEALNFGIGKTYSEIIITLDADTIFTPDTVRKIVRQFVDRRVAAVAGNAKVGNRINLLTRWQALEYITSQNLDRRAFEIMNCITVVPGAVGAWRRSVVIEAGGFSNSTLAEDADLTFSIIEKGYRVAFDDEAIGLTEAPDTIRNFVKQRFRWMYGTLQTVWKHKKVLMRKKYGALGIFAVPNVLIFQVFFPLISPVMDLMLVVSIIWILLQRHYNHLDFSASTTFHKLLVFYILFTLIDLITSAIPFILERKEKWSLLIWLPLQRFLYRQLIYYVAVKSVFTAIKGRLVGWGKFERKATVVDNS